MVGIVEFIFGFVFGLVVAVRGFSLRPDLAIKFKDAIEVFQKKEKRIVKPTVEYVPRDKGDFL